MSMRSKAGIFYIHVIWT